MDYKQKLSKIKNKVFKTYMENKKYVSVGFHAINMIQYVKNKNYIDLVKTSIETLNMISNDSIYAQDVFNEKAGWKILFENHQTKLIDIYINLIDQYPSEKIKLWTIANVYSLDNDIQIVSYKNSIYWNDSTIKYNSNLCTKEQVMKYLNDKIYEQLNSSCMQLFYDEKQIKLIPIKLDSWPSEVATKLSNYVKKSIELKMPRSIMLAGEPGAGKSAIASTLLNNLELKTLVIQDFAYIGFENITTMIKLFNIDAILIDDLDHANINANSEILGFLEKIRKSVKLIIATVNATNKFHKALIRPGRFDKIILSNKLDDGVIKNILGVDLMEYFDKVKDWPIAYINEFVLSTKLEDKSEIEIIIKDLNKRISADTIDLDLETYVKKPVIIDEKADEIAHHIAVDKSA